MPSSHITHHGDVENKLEALLIYSTEWWFASDCKYYLNHTDHGVWHRLYIICYNIKQWEINLEGWIMVEHIIPYTMICLMVRRYILHLLIYRRYVPIPALRPCCCQENIQRRLVCLCHKRVTVLWTVALMNRGHGMYSTERHAIRRMDRPYHLHHESISVSGVGRYFLIFTGSTLVPLIVENLVSVAKHISI